MEKTLGHHLQNWLIRNKMGVSDPMFVDAVNHTIENAIRDNRGMDAQANSSISKSASTNISRSSCLSIASTAASPNDLPTLD